MKLLKLFVLFTLIAYNVSAQLIYRKGTASGTDTYTVTVTPTFTAYYEDQRFLIEFTNANTGAATLNVNSKGAVSIVKNSNEELEADDIKAGEIKFLVYDSDSSRLQCLNCGGGGSGSSAAGDVSFTPAGNLESDNVQDAVEELDGEKLSNVVFNIGGLGANRTLTTTPSFASLTSGQTFICTFTAGSSGAMTLNVNSIGAKAVVKNTNQALASGDVVSRTPYVLMYNSQDDNFKLLGRFVSFTNGLSESSGVVRLGGTLTESSTQFTLPNTASAGWAVQSHGGKVIHFIQNGTSTLESHMYLGAIGATENTFLVFDPYQIQGEVTDVPNGVYFTNAVGYSVDISGDLTDQIIPRYKDVKDYADTKLPAASTPSTGTDVAFDIPRTYGYAADATGNITFTTTGLVEGVTQLMIHNDSSEPTFESGMVVISGTYATGVDNYIMFHAVKSDLILVTISQEQ